MVKSWKLQLSITKNIQTERSVLNEPATTDYFETAADPGNTGWYVDFSYVVFEAISDR
jgi:hypothetical protein